MEYQLRDIMKKIIAILLIAVSLSILYILLAKDSTLKIGFIGGLSGRFAKLGNDTFNSVKFAFEEINYKIGNNNIVLIPKDDEQDLAKARKGITELLNEDVKLTIGNITSSMTKESLKVINDKDMILFSPTARSNDLINLDDNFLRAQDTYMPSSFNVLSKYLVKHDIKKILYFYNNAHPSILHKYLNDFQKSFQNLGGEKFVEGIEIDETLEDRIKKIDQGSIDAILIISGSYDSAKVAQFLKREDFNKQIIITEWAYYLDFLENGGKAIENILLLTSYNMNSKSKEYLEFVKNYKDKFKKSPTPYSMHAYETARIIIETLKKDDNILNLKSNILKQKVFQGLQGKIIFNQYGDVVRDYFLVKIKNNKFVKIDE